MKVAPTIITKDKHMSCLVTLTATVIIIITTYSIVHAYTHVYTLQNNHISCTVICTNVLRMIISSLHTSHISDYRLFITLTNVLASSEVIADLDEGSVQFPSVGHQRIAGIVLDHTSTVFRTK